MCACYIAMLSEGEKIINSKQGGLINEGKRINSSLQLISGDFYIQGENNITFIKFVSQNKVILYKKTI